MAANEAIVLDERGVDGTPGLRVVMDVDNRLISVRLIHEGQTIAGVRTECGKTALGAFYHPFAQIDGAADTLAELHAQLAGAAAPAAPGAPAGDGDVPEGGDLRELPRNEEDGA